jgi:16S rRNA (cytosine1402-N4)-methyltransferase
MYHRSVLLTESVEAMNINPGGRYVDATFGGGGHAGDILKRLTTGKLYAFDQDEEAIANRPNDPNLIMIHSNFKHIRNFLLLYNAIPVNGILADLGVSSHQFDSPERGFSTRLEGRLDMRMDKRSRITAGEVVNTYSENALRDIFFAYGEVAQAARAASLIVHARKEQPVETTTDLMNILKPVVPAGKENKFFAQLFQSLRIEVNRELDALKEFLLSVPAILISGGRLVIISYHSLEDRLVKNYLRSGNWEGTLEKDFYGNVISPFRIITRKPVRPSDAEINENSRARSARLRVAEKKQG